MTIEMHVFYDKDGDIKGMSPSQNDYDNPDWSSAMFPLEEVESFLLGKKNSFNYKIKKIKNLAGEKFVISEKVTNPIYTRSVDNYLKEIEAPEAHVTVITITNQKTDKMFVVEFSKEFKLLCEDNTEIIQDILSKGMVYIYITKKHNPYHLLFKINLSPKELLEKDFLTFEYDGVIEDASAYTKKILGNYGYRETTRALRTLDHYVNETENSDKAVITITNHKTDKTFIIKLSQKFKLLFKNNKEMVEKILGTDMIPIYFTKKHNPYQFILKIDISPLELFEKDHLILNYDCVIEDVSVFTKKIKCGYREIIRRVDYYVNEIDNLKSDSTIIIITNQKTDKVFIVEFLKKFTLFEDDKEVMEDILSKGEIPIYITKKHNPYHLLFTIDFSPQELLENGRLYFNYDGVIDDASAYTKKVIDRFGYREVFDDV